ncbi:MAG: molecular chaperone DnaJ [Gammaproteobacteria bacterium]|nr:MAG: molecular chaperone DnaJ [Gammaproteobacteria bacterium]
MIIRVLLLFLLAVFFAALLRLLWLRYRPDVRQLLLAGGIAAGLLVILVMVATGRLHWIAVVLATVLPFAFKLLAGLGLMRLLRSLGGGPTPFPGGGGPAGGGGSRASEVATRFLRMALHHATGELEGHILEGPQAGRTLAELTFAEQSELLHYYRREDPDSARLLETWLDRTHGAAWRAADEAPAGSELTRAEALRVLDLGGQPDREQIIRAHRRMMQKFHPDHGGSEDLAARINAAKERLLRDLGS